MMVKMNYEDLNMTKGFKTQKEREQSRPLKRADFRDGMFDDD